MYKSLTCIRDEKWENILFSVLSGSFIVLPFGFVIVPAIFYNIMYLLTFIIGILCISLLYLFYYIMPKRTIYGNEILEKIERIQKLFGNIRKIKTWSFNNSKSYIFLWNITLCICTKCFRYMDKKIRIDFVCCSYMVSS